jgi:hypothetical protein
MAVGNVTKATVWPLNAGPYGDFDCVDVRGRD